MLQITKDNFETQVLRADKPVLVDFWATWCGPCKMIAPVLAEIAEERTDILVGKINVDEETELAIRFGIVSIPTVLVFKNGQIVNKTVGYCGKDTLLRLLAD